MLSKTFPVKKTQILTTYKGIQVHTQIYIEYKSATLHIIISKYTLSQEHATEQVGQAQLYEF